MPTTCFDTVYHIGKLDQPRRPRTTSYEGWGLSIGRNPQDWARVAGGVSGGEPWRLEKKDGTRACFVDMHRLTGADRRAIEQRARQRGWLETTPVTTWCVDYWDDEYEEERYMCFAEEGAAREEVDWMEGAASVEKTQRPQATPALRQRWRRWFSGDLEPDQVGEAAVMAVLEDDGRYEGLWWEDTYDPMRLSAPRGAIFQKRLPRWRRTRVAALPPA